MKNHKKVIEKVKVIRWSDQGKNWDAQKGGNHVEQSEAHQYRFLPFFEKGDIQAKTSIYFGHYFFRIFVNKSKNLHHGGLYRHITIFE